MIIKPDISIVILNFNSITYLEKCLASIKENELEGINIQILVIDNGSTDGSISTIRTKYPGVSLIASKTNKGFAAGNNLARNSVEGRYLLFLNPDTVLEKDTLAKVYNFLEDHKDVGAATCKLVLPNGKLDYSTHRGFPTPINAFFYFFTPFSKLFPRVKLFSGYTQGWKLNNLEPHEVDAISGAFFFVRAKAADEVGWWDEDYFWYGEDLEFCFRLKAKGWKVMFLPQVTALHHKGVTSGIKEHSKAISSASVETKRRSVLASTQVMRIFYKKHYLSRYPKILGDVVLLGIKLLEKARMASI